MNLPSEWRSYRLLKIGVSLAEQEETPGVRLDWLLAIDSTVRQAENEATKG